MKRLSALLLLLVLLLTACSSPSAAQGSNASQSAISGSVESAPPTVSQPDGSQPSQPESSQDGPSAPYALPEGFVLLADAVPDILQEIRYYSTYNFVGSRIDGYEQPCAILTAEAARALRAVSDELLAEGYRLKIYDAYRPQSAVDHFVRWVEDLEDTAMRPYFYPEEDKSQLFAHGYIAARSGHSRGSTVDLTLLDEATGKELDMGGTFDYFGAPSHTDYAGLTPEQQANRALLRDAMLRHGFRALKTEWWHFTLREEPFPDSYFDFPVRAPD